MQLSAQSAQRIVDEIGTVVRQNINMMDDQGFIIASTDSSRIGHFHEGAKHVIDLRLPELYITPEAATQRVRAGLNLPITHSGEIVGVIGITGEYHQVSGHGQIVRKMTEILIREGIEQDEKRLNQRILSRFLEDWVLGNGLLHPQALAEHGLALGIDITLPRRVMVISFQELDQYIDSASGQKLIETVETAVANVIEAETGNMILRNTARQILLVRTRSEQHMEALARRLCRLAADEFGVRLAAGIDSVAPDIHQAYIQANKAWRSARMSRDGVRRYDQITLELFTGEITPQAKQEFLHKIFRGCTLPELERWITIIETYFAAEGSLNRASDMLYMHRNTLQFNLRKLRDLTGLDIRLPSNMAVYHLATLFHDELKSSVKL